MKTNPCIELIAVYDRYYTLEGDLAWQYIFKKHGKKAVITLLPSQELLADQDKDKVLMSWALHELDRLKYRPSPHEKAARHQRLLHGKHGLKRHTHD